MMKQLQSIKTKVDRNNENSDKKLKTLAPRVPNLELK